MCVYVCVCVCVCTGWPLVIVYPSAHSQSISPEHLLGPFLGHMIRCPWTYESLHTPDVRTIALWLAQVAACRGLTYVRFGLAWCVLARDHRVLLIEETSTGTPLRQVLECPHCPYDTNFPYDTEVVKRLEGLRTLPACAAC